MEAIETEAPAERLVTELETRVDEAGRAGLADLGYVGRLPDGLVQIYNDFKKAKDTLRPGRLSDEGFATVVTLYRLFHGK